MNAYSVWLGLGAAVGVWRVARQGQRWGEIAILTLFAALVGARLAYVLVNGAYFLAHPLQILAVWQGGLSWSGAFPAALIALILWSRRAGLPIGAAADALLPLVGPLAVALWLAAWRSGSAYGPLAPAGAWWGLPAPDESGLWAARLPLQLLAALTLLPLFAWLEPRPAPRGLPGWRSARLLLAFSLHWLLFSTLRVDPAPAWLGLRLDVWGALGVIFLAGAALLLLMIQRRSLQTSG